MNFTFANFSSCYADVTFFYLIGKRIVRHFLTGKKTKEHLTCLLIYFNNFVLTSTASPNLVLYAFRASFLSLF